MLRHGTSEMDVWRQDFKAEAGRKDRSYPSDIFQAYLKAQELSGVILELLSEGEKTVLFHVTKGMLSIVPCLPLEAASKFLWEKM